MVAEKNVAAEEQTAREAREGHPCQCRQCLRDRKSGTWIGQFFLLEELSRMILCQVCGNKRCPHATDHRHACTGSNAPGQRGSAYEMCGCESRVEDGES